jgi:hypothetical protein
MAREALNARWCIVNDGMRRDGHHLIGNPVRLDFQRVITGTDEELAL